MVSTLPLSNQLFWEKEKKKKPKIFNHLKLFTLILNVKNPTF